jgi:hypothetical protein
MSGVGHIFLSRRERKGPTPQAWEGEGLRPLRPALTYVRAFVAAIDTLCRSHGAASQPPLLTPSSSHASCGGAGPFFSPWEKTR